MLSIQDALFIFDARNKPISISLLYKLISRHDIKSEKKGRHILFEETEIEKLFSIYEKYPSRGRPVEFLITKTRIKSS